MTDCNKCGQAIKEEWCCKSFKYEQNKMEFYYTDNYGYISKSIGSKLTYCPFCGQKLKKPKGA